MNPPDASTHGAHSHMRVNRIYTGVNALKARITCLAAAALMTACCGRQSPDESPQPELVQLPVEMTEPQLDERQAAVIERFDIIVGAMEASYHSYCECMSTLPFADESAEDCYAAITANKVVPNACHREAALAHFDHAIPVLDCMAAEIGDADKCMQECPADEAGNILCDDVGAAVEACEELPGADAFLDALNACDIPEDVQW